MRDSRSARAKVKMMIFVKESVIRATPERVFAFHELPDALERLTPAWETARIVRPALNLRVGSTAIVETRLLGFVPVRWVAKHTAYDPPHMFEDVQVSGPFRRWRHRHVIEPHAEGAILRDEINFEPPFGLAGRLISPLLIVPRLRRLFEHRHNVTRQWCENRPPNKEGAEEHIEQQFENRRGPARGFIIAGVALAVLWGIAFLKGRA